jgi:hypothetical protein
MKQTLERHFISQAHVQSFSGELVAHLEFQNVLSRTSDSVLHKLCWQAEVGVAKSASVG